MGTDKDWETWGAADPYFGVCSEGRFHSRVLTPEAREEFFASGDAHVMRIWKDMERLFGVVLAPAAVLDFGCGVGRLMIPFACRSEQVTGADVSPSMLAEAKRNCRDAGITNVQLVESDDALSRVHGHFDLVHSYIVLQHIPWERGRSIVDALAERVTPKGVLAIQVLSGYEGPLLIRALVRLRYVFPPLNWLRNILCRCPLFEPAMQLHVYDLAVLRRELESRGFSVREVDERLDKFRSTLVYARRPGLVALYG